MLFLLVSLLYVVQSVQAHCSPPEKISNGQVSYPSSLANNSTATYTCNSGYVMTSGDAVRVCWYYYYNGTRPTCSDINECDLQGEQKCDANAVCTNTDGSYTCTCNIGYSGDGVTCSDMNECDLQGEQKCDANAVCTNTDGSYTCTCNTGYSGDGVTCSAGVDCIGECTDVFMGIFRLCNGSGLGVCHPAQGRLEVFFDNEWGTVCDDYWSDPHYPDYESSNANVTCRMFGYSSGESKPEAFFGEGVGTIMLDDIQCTGSELSLLDCPHSEWTNHNCVHFEDTGVICY